jgi:hypothetical protein
MEISRCVPCSVPEARSIPDCSHVHGWALWTYDYTCILYPGLLRQLTVARLCPARTAGQCGDQACDRTRNQAHRDVCQGSREGSLALGSTTLVV